MCEIRTFANLQNYPDWLRADGDACLIHVRLTPKSDRDALENAETRADGRQHLKARVRAVPEKGKANAALEALVAKACGVPRSDVRIVSGDTAREKTVRIEGMTPGAVLAAIAR